MTYYTHRKKMDAPQYVLFDVSSKHVSVWRIYYIRHK
jgi:hypothetical protein